MSNFEQQMYNQCKERKIIKAPEHPCAKCGCPVIEVFIKPHISGGYRCLNCNYIFVELFAKANRDKINKPNSTEKQRQIMAKERMFKGCCFTLAPACRSKPGKGSVQIGNMRPTGGIRHTI